VKADGLSGAAQLLLGGAGKVLGKLLASFAACHFYLSGDACCDDTVCKIAVQTALSQYAVIGQFSLACIHFGQMQLTWVKFSVLAACCLLHAACCMLYVYTCTACFDSSA